MTLSMILGGAATKVFKGSPKVLQRGVLFNTSFKCINYNFEATS